MADESTQLRDEADVWYYCEDGSACGNSGAKVGRIEQYTYMEYGDFVNANGERKTAWGMEQNAKMLPAYANGSSDGCNFGKDKIWTNKKAEQVQNWQRTDLSGLENAKYNPSRDVTSESNTSFSVSAPAGVSVSTSVDHPRLERDIVYQSDRKYSGYYDFAGYDAADENCQLGMTSTWITNRPSSDDGIAPSYFYGEFDGYDCDLNEYRTRDTYLFHFFSYSEF